MDKCPECGSENIWREEVDVGVGTVRGPYHCNDCGWSEYDTLSFPEEAQDEHSGNLD